MATLGYRLTNLCQLCPTARNCPVSFLHQPRVPSISQHWVKRYARCGTFWSKECEQGATTNAYQWESYLPPHFVDVAPLANAIRARVRSYAVRNKLKLVGILADIGPFRNDAELYSERIATSLQEDLIDYELWRCNAHFPVQIEDAILKANNAEDVDGILVFYPIFPSDQRGPYRNKLNGVYYKTHDDHFRDLVAEGKDVEGLRGSKWYRNSGRLSASQQPAQPVYPCTARSVQAILEEFHDWKSKSKRWEGEIVSIVNRSEIFGRPLATMLSRQGATVYSVDEATVLKFRPWGERMQRCSTSLEECISQSSIVVAGVPDEEFKIPTDCISTGASLINVSEYRNVDESLLVDRMDVRYISQVGKVTVAILEENLIKLHKLKKWSQM